MTIANRLFTITFDKKVVSYELSAASVDHLRFAGRKFWDAFEQPTIKLSLTPEK